MNESLEQVKNQTFSIWQSLDTSRKIIIGAVSLIVLVGMITLIIVSGKSDYSTLYSSLSESDAAAIVEKLKESKIPYRLVENGKGIEVESGNVYELRMQMASEGLPQGGGVGFEIFDKTNFAATDFTQRLNFQRALQGELARTIMQLEEVEWAKVHLALPEESLFSEEQKPTTASVVMKLKGHSALSEPQVAGIVHLVASSVEGLTPENITVVDTNGRILSASDNSQAGMLGKLTVSQIEAKRVYEEGIQKSIESMLDRVLGPGKAVVRVNAEMNFDEEQLNSETYEPLANNTGIIKDERKYQESQIGGSSIAAGVPGTSSNVPGYQGVTEGGSSQYTKSETVTNYEVNKKIQSVKKAVGTVRKLSVAALVDKSGLTNSEITMIKSTISAAAGIDQDRGDTITVQAMSFTPAFSDKELAEMEKAKAESEKKVFLRSMISTAAPIVLGLLLLIFALILISLFKRRREDEDEILLPASSYGVNSINRLEDNLAEDIADLSTLEPNPEQKKRQAMQGQIEKLADKTPEQVAKLLQGWLTEDK